ncbi:MULTISPECIES: hypothetical protein [Bradyrhizobium]|jgi:hypothetical protein|uniref:hypothetical protein n=1 Tax=Bradyrhizobium TaxID=374 RepID=UPI000A8FDF13|nr:MULTISPECIES: hypothetical protein [Bradyrhizobium]
MFNRQTTAMLRLVLDEVCADLGKYEKAVRAHVARPLHRRSNGPPHRTEQIPSENVIMQDRTKKRRRVKQTQSLTERLLASATLAKSRAQGMAPGHDRDLLLQKAREAEAAVALESWIRGPSSPR